jgi:hypothetical protein
LIFIEKELTECVELLDAKDGCSGKRTAGTWNKEVPRASGALVFKCRKWIGTEMYASVKPCARFLDGVYGSYSREKPGMRSTIGIMKIVGGSFCLPSARDTVTTFIRGSVLVDGPCRTIANYLGDTKAGKAITIANMDWREFLSGRQAFYH